MLGINIQLIDDEMIDVIELIILHDYLYDLPKNLVV